MPDKNLPFERFLDSLGEACLVVTPQGQILATNAAARTLYGADERSLCGRMLVELCQETERESLREHLERCGELARAFTSRQRRDDGTSFLGSFTAKKHAFSDDSESLTLIVRRLEDELSACNADLQLHHLMLESALDGIIAHTLDGELLYANSAAQEQWGLTLEDARARGPWGWVAPEMRGRISAHTAELATWGSARFESKAAGADGGGAVEVHARVVEQPSGRVVVATVRDISERVQTEEMVRYLAYHDGLTGLANRVLLEQELAHEMSVAERHGDLLGVAFLDLDNFKPVNDTHGHAIGDDVLREVANRISGCVREGDTVARVGGDEFVIVLPRLADAQALEVVAGKLCHEIARPIEIAGIPIRVTASIGTAVHRPGDDAETLLTRADLGMYESRRICEECQHAEEAS